MYYEIIDTTFPNGEAACVNWLAEYSTSTSLIYALSAFIAALSAGLRVFLREISVFEGKHTVAERLASATTKMWLVQFISTAVLLLMINARIRPSSKIFADEGLFQKIPDNSVVLQGQYDDFYANWYGVVGVYIVISCIISSLVPWANFGFWLMKGCFRCIDRGCTCKMERTRHLIQDDYEAQYLGAVF